RPTLFPYTTLFRSGRAAQQAGEAAADAEAGGNADAVPGAVGRIIPRHPRHILVTAHHPEAAVGRRVGDRAPVAEMVEDVVGVLGVLPRVMVEALFDERFHVESRRLVHVLSPV